MFASQVEKPVALERGRFSVGVAAMRHHAARRARALAGSVLRARGVAARLVRSLEARGSACLPVPSSSSSHPAGLPRSPFAAWTHTARPPFPGASTRRRSSLASAAAFPDASPPAAPPPTRGRLRQMRVAELRAACAARGLDDRGRKAHLVSRLEDAEGAVASIPEHETAAALEPRVSTATARTAALETSESSSESPRRTPRALSPKEHGIDPVAIPPYVRALQRRLASGDGDDHAKTRHRLFVVGGAARDLFLGRTPRDFDLLTDASWDVVKRRAQPCVVVGRRFKVAHCFEDTSGGDAHARARRGHPRAFFELVSMRADSEARARPRDAADVARDRLETLDAAVARRLGDDARRRDFTVNALAYDVESGFLYDFVGAIEDIESKTVRTVHPSAVVSFVEDPARMLRAVRVAARHDFVLAGGVVSALKASAHLLRREHTARLAGELRALLTRGFSERAVVLLWSTGVLEHVLHLHATHVARATDPETNFVAAPPGAFRFAADDAVVDDAIVDDAIVDDAVDLDLHPDATERTDATDASAGDGVAPSGRANRNRTSSPYDALPSDLPWRAAGFDADAPSGFARRDRTRPAGSALTRHRRGGKRVSDATLARVVREDPLFRVLRALDSRIRRVGDGHACSETLAMACLAAPFAVKKLGWPPLEPEPAPEGARAPADTSAVRRFASARLAARLAAFAASRSKDERRAWRAAAEKRAAVTTSPSSPRRDERKKKRRASGKSGRDPDPRPGADPCSAETLWRLAFSAWTEEASHAARVMQADYHLSAKHVMASALVTMHAPLLQSAPAADVLRRRAELARSSARPGKAPDFSLTAKPATFAFRESDATAPSMDAGLARALRLLAAGGAKREKSRRAASRRAGRRRGARPEAAPSGGGGEVTAFPGELLAFAEILCDAALDGAVAVHAADAEGTAGDVDEESDAARYEIGDDDDFDPDEPL